MDILLSCRVPWPSKIFDEPKEGEARKDVELRKSWLHFMTQHGGDRVLIYETSPTKAIVGVAECVDLSGGNTAASLWNWYGERTGFDSLDSLKEFSGGHGLACIELGERERLYVPLDDMKRLFDIRAPQSFRYLECPLADRIIDAGRGKYNLYTALGMKEWA